MNISQKLDNLTFLIQKQEGTISGINEKQDVLCGEIQSIKQVLGGSKLGDKGIIEQFADLKSDYYNTKSEVNRLKWFAGVITATTTTAIGYVYKKLFE